MSRGKVFILSAPSGAGKSTVLKDVMANMEGVVFSVSHTTRLPRKGEKDGVEYHFVTRDVFLDMQKSGVFLEYAEVHGNFYATSRLAVEEQIARGVDVVLDIDVQGASIIKESSQLHATYIFLAPPSAVELERRLRGRGLDSEETISVRLKNAEDEMKSMNEFDYLIVNESVDDAVKMFEAVILAERARDRRNIQGQPLAVNAERQ